MTSLLLFTRCVSKVCVAGLLAHVAVCLDASAASAQSADDRFVHQQFTASGFIPLDEMTFGGRDVRRVLPIDPYHILSIAGIELEQHADGRRTIRMQYVGWTGQVHAVSPDEWAVLANLEAPAYAPPPKPKSPRNPNVVVHCWGGLFEASPNQSASWWGCDGPARPGQAYLEAVMTLAMHKAGCAPSDKDVYWRYSDCSANGATLDDPALASTLADLRARWTRQREPGGDILARARIAIRTARATPDDATFAAARDAVFAFGAQQEALRQIVRSGFAPFQAAEQRGGRNAAILSAIRRGWNEDIRAQDNNYIELLQELARLQPAVRKPAI